MDQATQVRARLDALDRAIFAAVKPSDPEPANWLESDCSFSYCHEHAIEARAKEFGLGPPIYLDRWWRRTDLEDHFYAGIGGGYYGQGECDNVERCHTCDKLLAYSLTDHGAEQEVDYWLNTKVIRFADDEAYELYKLMAHAYPEGPERSLELAEDILKVAEDVAAFLGLSVENETAT